MSDKLTDSQMDKEVKSVEEELKKSEKVKVFIPIDKLNPKDVTVIGLNGFNYVIPRGKQVDVPEPIANIYFYSQEKTDEANIKADELMKDQEIE